MSSDVVTVPLQLRWGDMDVNAHVNNVAIARLFEESRVRASHRLLARDAFGSDGRVLLEGGLVVVRQEVEFLATMPYSEDGVTCSVWLSRVGRTSFDFAARLAGLDGTAYAQAETTLVRVDGSGRPEALPDDVVAAMAGRLREPLPLRSRSGARA
ncbi:MAG: acyl-CoA thioesterase [Gordonia paraffinivorans]